MKPETIEKVRRLCEWAVYWAEIQREVDLAREILAELDASASPNPEHCMTTIDGANGCTVCGPAICRACKNRPPPPAYVMHDELGFICSRCVFRIDAA